MLVTIAFFVIGISLLLLIEQTDNWTSAIGFFARLACGVSICFSFPLGFVSFSPRVYPADAHFFKIALLAMALSATLASWLINGWTREVAYIDRIVWAKVIAVPSAMFAIFAALYR